MTAAWPCMALREPLTDGTPEPATDATTNAAKNYATGRESISERNKYASDKINASTAAKVRHTMFVSKVLTWPIVAGQKLFANRFPVPLAGARIAATVTSHFPFTTPLEGLR